MCPKGSKTKGLRSKDQPKEQPSFQVSWRFGHFKSWSQPVDKSLTKGTVVNGCQHLCQRVPVLPHGFLDPAKRVAKPVCQLVCTPHRPLLSPWPKGKMRKAQKGKRADKVKSGNQIIPNSVFILEPLGGAYKTCETSFSKSTRGIPWPTMQLTACFDPGRVELL